MNLKPSEKRDILAGKHPSIVRTEKGEGEEVVLRSSRTPSGPVPQVVVTITGWRKNKHGGFKALYSVRDDRELYLNRGLGYTRSRSRALDTEAPVLDEETAQKFAMEGEQKTALQRAEHEQRQKTGKAEAKAGRGKQAQEAAIRQRGRLESA